MLEEQYQKQEELEKKHTDRVNSIEDELKTARGDRREHLIDQLAQERNAQIKALQSEREIEKEKEQNQKKQKQLEKQQEALEKKRWEQTRKNQVVRQYHLTQQLPMLLQYSLVRWWHYQQ